LKTGYRIEIQKDLSEEQMIAAKRAADNFIDMTLEKSGKYGDGGRTSSSWYKRGILGYFIDSDGKITSEITELIFRRHTRNKRIFAIIKLDTLILPNGDPIKLNNCMCVYHRGGQKVTYKVRPETFLYFEIGDIKG